MASMEFALLFHLQIIRILHRYFIDLLPLQKDM